MKVLYNNEDGVYLSLKAALSLFSENSEFYEYNSLESIFSALDLDHNSFSILKIKDSKNGLNQNILNHLFKRKYKIFAEVFVLPEHRLFYTSNLNPKIIKKIYLENITLDLLPEIKSIYEGVEVIVVTDLNQIIEENPENIAFISTKDFTRDLKIKLIRKDIKLKQKPQIQYIIVGRTYYDLPSDDSDKVILICNFDKKVLENEILDSIKIIGMTVFKIQKNPNEKVNEYFIEIGFHGLLDLHKLEELALELRILGIIESGKIIKL